MAGFRPFSCSLCHKRFSSRIAVHDHAASYHKARASEVVSLSLREHRERFPERHMEREPSLGQQVAEASLACALGEPVDPTIEMMFGDYL